MNILITINKSYAKQLNVLLNSIQYSNPKEKFEVYILHKDLEEKDILLIKNGLDENKFYINNIKIPKSEIDTFPVYEKRYPVEIYFRIFASKYLPQNIEKILYLDADTLVINKLDELYKMDFEGNYYIAATHIRKLLHKFHEIRLNIAEDEPYINTGVLLINLKELRKLDIEKNTIEFVRNNRKKLMLPDQDIITAMYGDKIKLIDTLKYNLGERALDLYNLNHPQNQIGLKWIRKNTVIIHYYGKNKPWNKQYIGKLNCFYNKIQKSLKTNNKVLILSCGTGGGHNSAAKAIREELLEKGLEADFMEYLDIVNPKTRDKVNNLYLATTKENGKIFKAVYKLGEIYQKTNFKSPIYALNLLNKNRLYNYIKENNYSYVITTHLFPTQTLTAIKKDYSVKFIAIATDYVSIPFWEETNPDYYIIPNEELKKDFIAKGIKEEKLLPLGIPTAKVYREDYDKLQCKKQLNLKENKKYVLILTGSMGFGNVEQIIRNLEKNIKDVCFIVSCGHNNKLKNMLDKEYKDNDRILAISFTNQLDKYIKSSDVVLTKPGGLTTTEVATIRKPLIHTMPIPGCENYNADFFDKRKMSIKCNSIEEILNSTRELLNNKELQQVMMDNQAKYIKKDSCEKISNIVIQEMKLGEKICNKI